MAAMLENIRWKWHQGRGASLALIQETEKMDLIVYFVYVL